MKLTTLLKDTMTKIISTPNMNLIKIWNLNIRGEIYTKEMTHRELKKFLRESPEKVAAIYPIWNFEFTGGAK